MVHDWDLVLERTRQVLNERTEALLDAMRSNPADAHWTPPEVSNEELEDFLTAAWRGEPRSMCPAYRAAHDVIHDRLRGRSGMASRFAW